MTFPFPRAVAVTLAAFAFSLSGAAAQSFNDRQKDEIRALIRDYMLSNPEIIQEAMNELERKQADAEKTARAKALDELAGALADSPRAIVVGNPGLKPWTADSFHLSLDSYHLKGGFGSFGVYRKKVSNFLISWREFVKACAKVAG